MMSLDLKSLTQKQFKTSLDESWKFDEDGKRRNRWRYLEIHGRYGMIYPHSADTLIARFRSKKVGLRVLRNFQDRCFLHRESEDELELRFSPKDWRIACGAIQAYKRRQLSPEERQKALLNLKDVNSKVKSPRLNISSQANLGHLYAPKGFSAAETGYQSLKNQPTHGG